MARSTFKILFYIDKRAVKLKEDGTTAVMCRISVDGKTASIATGQYIAPNDWDTNNENRELQQLRKRIVSSYNTLLSRHSVVSAEMVKNHLNGVAAPPEYLLQAGEEERERLRLRAIEINSNSTHRQSKTTQKNLRDFIASRGAEDILFTDITPEFAESFKLFLKGECGYKAGHINHCLTWLNRLVFIAVDREILRCNPIEGVSYEKKKPLQLRHLSREELKRIMESPLPDELPELARRMFIFCAFCGLAYVDMQALYPNNISQMSDGRRYIRVSRVKTKVESFIPLHPIAEQILNLYNIEDESQPIFPQKNRDVICREVNQFGIMVGAKVSVSPHVARHCFGTQMLNAGVPIESISKMMGHTNIQSTQVYARVTDDKISADMDRLIERRKLNCLNN
ncbi:MAG: site-specific integrase [Rikenellaceae bacterium]